MPPVPMVTRVLRYVAGKETHSWAVSCCSALPKPRSLQRRVVGYRTRWRASVVLARHLLVEHAVHVAPARIRAHTWTGCSEYCFPNECFHGDGEACEGGYRPIDPPDDTP